MKTVQEASERWVKKSLQAYLEGSKDLRWIVGILSGLSQEEVQAVLSSVVHHALPERQEEFNRWLNQ